MPLRFDLFTLFPDICVAYLQESILKRAQEAGLVSVHIHNIRDYAEGKHRVTDDLPYGGGGGMVMKPEPVFAAVESVLGQKLEVRGQRSSIGPLRGEMKSQKLSLRLPTSDLRPLLSSSPRKAALSPKG